MTNIALKTIRTALPKLAAVIAAADEDGYTNGRVNGREASAMAAKIGFGGDALSAIEMVQRNGAKRYGTSSPTLQQMNNVLAEGMRVIAKRAGKMLSPTQQASLAPTWMSIVEFARATKGKSVEQILGG